METISGRVSTSTPSAQSDGAVTNVPLAPTGALRVDVTSQGGTTVTVPLAPSDAEANSAAPRVGAFALGLGPTSQWYPIRVGQVGPQSTLNGFLDTIALAQFLTTEPTPSNAQVTALQGDGNGYLKTVARPSDLCVTNTGTSGNGVTLTLPAVSGKFHYINQIVLQRFAVAALTAAATPVLVTTTNLPGTLVFSVDASAAAQGTIDKQEVNTTSSGLKSSVVNTNTTIVCPATTNVIWRVTAYYYAAP